jgi:cell division control protein 7
MGEANNVPSGSDFAMVDAIGSGSFSNVFHAIHIRSGTHVALKRLFWNNAPDRIVKEIKWLLAMEHSNIVRLPGIFREADQATHR